MWLNLNTYFPCWNEPPAVEVVAELELVILRLQQFLFFQQQQDKAIRLQIRTTHATKQFFHCRLLLSRLKRHQVYQEQVLGQVEYLIQVMDGIRYSRTTHSTVKAVALGLVALKGLRIDNIENTINQVHDELENIPVFETSEISELDLEEELNNLSLPNCPSHHIYVQPRPVPA